MFSQFLYNASWPLIIIGFLVAAFFGAMFIDKIDKVDDPFQLIPMLGGFAVGCVLLLFGWAAPEPNIGTKIVYKDRVVQKQPQFLELYDKCMEDATDTNDPADQRNNITTCNNVAMMQSGRQMLLTRTVVQPRDRIVYKQSPWKELYETCMGKGIIEIKGKEITNLGWEPGEEGRDARIKLCAGIASEQTKKIILSNEAKYATQH